MIRKLHNLHFWRALITASLLSLAGCQTPASTLHSRGPAAGQIAPLAWSVYITFCVISLVMWALLLWAATRRRGSLDTHEPWNEGGGQAWVVIGGFLIPLIVLSTIFVFGLTTLRSFPVDNKSDMHPEIRVIGHQWWWEVQYIGKPPDQQFTTANEIHIPVGRPITIELVTRDVIHSFWVPALHGKVDLMPGQRNYIHVEASEAGDFRGQCAEYCGEQHAHMLLLVVAQPDAEYEAWYQQQLNPAGEPTTAEALHGRDVFMGSACALCHEIRGTVAHGHVAPDLTHLASRQGIAANSYANNGANLEAWFTHAQSLKPGAEMPDLAEYNGKDARALLAFLQQLK
ncbi:MAG TPA: cytochrome c oxidase subunit II [Terriglobales bacterium]|jgi:cytochrome c oxidase subunit 2|nr:cytochrome c oxidase subunit II [Terriglobales bacterium]